MSSNEVDGPHPNADSAQATMATPVGPITVTGNGRSIVRVTWVESAEVDFSAAPPASAVSDPLLTEAMRQLRAYFNGSLSTFDLPIDLGQISAVARTVLTTLDETVETWHYGHLRRACPAQRDRNPCTGNRQHHGYESTSAGHRLPSSRGQRWAGRLFWRSSWRGIGHEALAARVRGRTPPPTVLNQ